MKKTQYQLDSAAIDEALAISRAMSYDGKKEGPAKHALRDLAHRLGNRVVRVVAKDGRQQIMSCYGRSRPLTLGEWVLHRLFGVVPPFEGWRGDKS